MTNKKKSSGGGKFIIKEEVLKDSTPNKIEISSNWTIKKSGRENVCSIENGCSVTKNKENN